MRKCLLTLVGLAIAGGSAGYAYSADNTESTDRPKTTSAADSAKKITAVGTVEPQEMVDVSAQVPGKIVSLGADPQARGKTIDYGSSVEPGTVLAQLDSAEYALHVEHAQADCTLAEAELVQAQAKLEVAETQWQLAQTNHTKGAIRPSDFGIARSNYKAAKAGVAAAEAALALKKVTLKEAQLALGYTTIKSPIKGTVIDRRVNVGQMAIGSLSLFLIADAQKLQVWASVNEADIARIRPQQSVHFTVDAFPGRVFEGRVKQIRLNAAMVQNTVTYTVVVAISSATDKLLPYLTAHLEFE